MPLLLARIYDMYAGCAVLSIPAEEVETTLAMGKALKVIRLCRVLSGWTGFPRLLERAVSREKQGYGS